MIITRTPFRISMFGGGTDYPNWYKENGGAVINTTINKYCYIMCRYFPPFFKHKYHIRYRLTERSKSINKINHPTVRECLRYMKIERGIEMVHTADLPARSGMGSSSSFTVCFLHALNALSGKMITKRNLALDAIHVEQNLVKENIGSQDQVAAAFGGLNKIDFKDDNIIVNPIILDKDFLNEFSKSFMLFFTGFSRTASDVAGKYIYSLPKNKKKELIEMKQLVNDALDILHKKDSASFGKLLNETWKIKKTFSKNITNDDIDNMYNVAMRAGAYGGKLCGAGGGGFLLLSVPEHKQLCVKIALGKLLYVPFQFDTLGSQIIMYHQQDM